MLHVNALLIRHLSVTPSPLGKAKNIPRFELCQPHSARHFESRGAAAYEESCAGAIERLSHFFSETS